MQYNEYDNAYYLGNDDNSYVVLMKAKSTDITGCTINEKCKFIYDSAFSRCSGLTSINIPDSVTSIGNSAFEDCYGLTNITIPNSVTSIGNSAFEDCYGLTNITIPNSVTSIGSYAFGGCGNLTSVVFVDTSAWYIMINSNKEGGTQILVKDSSTNATYFKTYDNYYWYKV